MLGRLTILACLLLGCVPRGDNGRSSAEVIDNGAPEENVDAAPAIQLEPLGRTLTDADVDLPDGIPADLDEALEQLQQTIPTEDLERFAASTEEELDLYIVGSGMALRERWDLWRGSALQRWFREQEIHHPDDMSSIIVTSLWHRLNGRDIELEEQIRFYHAYWECMERENQPRHYPRECMEDLLRQDP